MPLTALNLIIPELFVLIMTIMSYQLRYILWFVGIWSHLEKEMVLLRLYSIYDNKAEQFSPPQVYHNDMLALRAFEGLVNDDKMLINTYPEDFSIYYLGNIGDSDGRYYIETSDESRVPILVGRAIDYVQDVDNDPT